MILFILLLIIVIPISYSRILQKKNERFKKKIKNNLTQEHTPSTLLIDSCRFTLYLSFHFLTYLYIPSYSFFRIIIQIGTLVSGNTPSSTTSNPRC